MAVTKFVLPADYWVVSMKLLFHLNSIRKAIVKNLKIVFINDLEPVD